MTLAPQTPQRPLPGAYLATPAPNRSQAPPTAPGPAPPSVAYPTLPVTPQGARTSPAQTGSSPATAAAAAASKGSQPLQIAARTINDFLARDNRFPELDTYVGQGTSSDIRVVQQPAWLPFQQTKRYDIPEKILDQYNRAQISTLMGLLPEVQHAWITIDNALYLWDYTHPNPELIGFEEQPNSITAVKLVTPKPGVFTSQITHVLVVATTADVVLLGLSSQPGPAGTPTVTLYQTRMTLSTRGMAIHAIEGAQGRIFFASRADNDVYEMTYQQEEKWFHSRCAKINHTARGLSSLALPLSTLSTTFSLGRSEQEHITQMRADDSRSLLYTLSSTSTIRTFHVKPNDVLDCTIVQTLSMTLSNIGHMVSRTDLLSPSVSVVSIGPIAAPEAQKLHLVATTSTGCRLFMSATASSSWVSTSSSNAPTSMRVQHIKFPPSATEPSTPGRSELSSPAMSNGSAELQSKVLTPTRAAERFSPGYFFCFVDDPQRHVDTLFLAAPDSGQIFRPQERASFPEHGSWLALESQMQDIGLVTPPFVAATTPVGFGNEMAIQFDRPPAEVAVLTNNGVYILRRRRLVEVLASIIQYHGADEGLQAEVTKFYRRYGTAELVATALAVACGHGQDIPPDARAARVSGSEVSDHARRIFLDWGGRPTLRDDVAADKTTPVQDSVQPSARHQGVAVHIARVMRSTWPARVMRQGLSATGSVSVTPGVALSKLRDIQRDMTNLLDFLTTNKSFIDGLAGADGPSRPKSKQEDLALQGEHLALQSLVALIANVIEGISFVLVLFDERVEDIIVALSDGARQKVQSLTFQQLFVTEEGKELAKELVKAIVNRNIANGSNIDTVADALRRRCGSFCSADDVVIFKAQEQLKKASEAGSNVDSARRLLNESLRLFQQVAGSLSTEQLEWAVRQFVEMSFYAGGIQLALTVAREKDRGNRALAWINHGRRADVWLARHWSFPPANWCEDPGQSAYEQRTRIYQLVQEVITKVDHAARQAPEMVDGIYTTTAKRCREAYAVIDDSSDEVFQYNLYDWYLENGWTDRLLAVRSPLVVSYLEQKAKQSADHADLMWKYFAQRERYHDAAAVQLQLAKSQFRLPLEKRIEYLSKAKANASTFTPGIGRQSRQVLLHEISELLDVANIQDDLLQRLRDEPRLTPERKNEVLDRLNGQVLGLSVLFNEYVDPASYFDICLLIFQAADHRNLADVKATWQNQLEQTHQEAARNGDVQPWEAVAEKVRSVGARLHLSESTFPVAILLPLLERYAFEFQRNVGPPEWVVDTFLSLQISYETILPVLESMFYNDEAPFQGPNRKYIANDIIYVCKRWYNDSVRGGQPPFGRPDNIVAVSQLLLVLLQNGIDEDKVEECRALRNRIEHFR